MFAQRLLNGIGVVLTLGCVATMVAGNTQLVGPFEHAPMPLSWLLGGAAMAAFLATELCDARISRPMEEEEAMQEFSSEWNTAELRG